MTDQLHSFFDIFSRKNVEQFARASGFIKRLRKISGLDFLTQLTYGLVGLKHPSLGAMVAVVDARFTREALHYRFNASAVAFLMKCFNHSLQHRLAPVPISTALLDAYRRVLIVDSSSWDVSPKLQHLLPGSGGDSSPANCKIQVGYEYKGGELSFFEMTPGNLPDNRYTGNLRAHVKATDLLLIDLGYFKLTTFSAIHKKKAFFLSRFLIGTSLFTQHTFLPLDLEIVLANATKDSFELDVVLGKPGKMEIPCRLICQRVDPAAANRRRARLYKNAKKKAARRVNYISNLPIGHC